MLPFWFQQLMPLHASVHRFRPLCTNNLLLEISSAPSVYQRVEGWPLCSIGVDLNLQMAALMNCSTGKVAVATPQVNEVPLISVWSYNLVF